jgi:F plasmid transfer operon, TraF, protein
VSAAYAKLTGMGRSFAFVVVACLFSSLSSAVASAQTFETLGTRASGMGGAFVAVADDASAVYWNPAGLALGGSYFSSVLDYNMSEVEPDDPTTGGRQSASLIALSTLPVGVSYYRLSSSTLRQSAALGTARLERLTTHHAGVTVVQQLGEHVAIGSTLKWVHGFAASGIVPAGDRDDLLDGAGDLPDHSTNKFDMDVGVMALVGKFHAGVTVRNLIEPDFTTASGSLLTLKRRTRAGFSYLGVAGLIVAADIDIERAEGALGEIRNLATGAEAKLWPRVTVRSGFRFNTIGDEPGGHAPVYSIGGTVATFRSLLIDGQYTFGSEWGDRSWGVAARMVY